MPQLLRIVKNMKRRTIMQSMKHMNLKWDKNLQKSLDKLMNSMETTKKMIAKNLQQATKTDSKKV